MVFKALDDMASDYLSSMCTERSTSHVLSTRYVLGTLQTN